MTKKRCIHMNELQDYLDGNGPGASLDTVRHAHLYGRGDGYPGCRVCREFYEGYGDFLKLYEQVEADGPGQAVPGKERARKIPHPRLFRVAAAAALFVMATAGGVQVAGFYQRRQVLKEDTKFFVELLMEPDLLESGGYESDFLEDWFEADFL